MQQLAWLVLAAGIHDNGNTMMHLGSIPAPLCDQYGAGEMRDRSAWPPAWDRF